MGRAAIVQVLRGGRPRQESMVMHYFLSGEIADFHFNYTRIIVSFCVLTTRPAGATNKCYKVFHMPTDLARMFGYDSLPASYS